MRRNRADRTGLVLLMLLCFSAAGAQVEAPRVTSNPDPVYPQEAKGAGLGGKVFVHMRVDKKGKGSVENAFGPNALCTDLDDKRIVAIRQAAVEAAKKVTFDPPTKELAIVVTYIFDPVGPRPKDPVGENKPKLVEGGVINGRALRLPKPGYSSIARAGRVGGAVSVSVLISEDGSVHSAGAVSGHPALIDNAVKAACGAKFSPTVLQGTPVTVSGIITYVFRP